MSLRDAYDELIDLAPAARVRRLGEMALSDSDRAMLRAMLAERTADVFDHPVASLVQSLQPDEPLFRHMLGRQVGRFTLVELIGEGGSSVVFRAERPAGSGKQEVALKILRASRLSDDAGRRFEREQAILAQLSHPNIARFIESGVVEGSGLPYLAMELVRGLPVTEACAQRQLDLPSRLRLVSDLSRAMQAAHSALVVHCDLKPTNVLVDDEGRLQVLDFGIARLVDAEAGPDATRTLALTPEYAAPEQFALAPPHIAVDIHAIGVLLAEILTGERFSAFQRKPVSSIATIAAEGGDARRAGLPAPATLARLLRGDLDAIVAKATATSPDDRYASAEALGKDIDRYLAGRPVEARRASGWRRAAKFVKRHRMGAGLAALAIVLLCATTVAATQQAIKARRAVVAAEEQANRADAVRNLAFDFFSEAEPGDAQRKDVTVAQAVERAIARLSADHAMSPRIRIDLLMRLAVTLGRRGSPERAIDLLEGLHEEARATLGAHDVLTLAVLERASKYDLERGEFDAARAKIDALLADQAVPGSGELQANVLLRAASLAWKTGDFAGSLRDSASALELANALGDKAIASEALTMRAGALLASGDAANALDAYEQLVQDFKERYGPVHAQVSLAYSGLARAYRRLGRLAESEDAARAAIAIDRQVYAANHWILANHLNALVMTLLERRKFDEALQAAEESLEICRLTLADGHIDLTTSKYTVGNVLLQMGRYRDALGYLREALAEHAAALGDESSDTLVTRSAYGYALAMAGEKEAGVRELEAAIDVNRRRDSPDYTLLAKAMEKRIRLAIADSDPQAAKARLPALEEVVRSMPAHDRRAWCARDATLRARAAYSAGEWTAVEPALQAAASTIGEHGCGNEAVAVENALLRVLVRSRQALANDASDARETYARALSLKFPPQEVAELTQQMRVVVR